MILFLLLCTITNAKISVKYESKSIKKCFFIEGDICFSHKKLFVFLNSKVKAGKNIKIIPLAFEVASIEDKLNWKNTCCGIEFFNKKGSVSFIFNHKSFRVSLSLNISDRISAGVMVDSNNFVKAVEYFKKDSSDSSSSSDSDEVEGRSLSSHDSSSDHEDEHDKSEKKESSGISKESNNSSDSDEVEGRSLSSHGSSSDHEDEHDKSEKKESSGIFKESNKGKQKKSVAFNSIVQDDNGETKSLDGSKGKPLRIKRRKGSKKIYFGLSGEIKDNTLKKNQSSNDHREVTKNDSVHQKCFIEALPAKVIYEILCYCGAPILDRDFFRFFW